MPPSLPFFSLLFLLLLLTASTAHLQTSRRLLQSTLPPPPPPPPPHHHHHHTPRSPPPSPPQLNPAPPAPTTPPKQAPAVTIPPASAPPPTPTPTTPIPTPTTPPPPPTPTSTATPTPDAYPFTNYPFFPTSSPPPPLPEQPSPDASRTFPANITNLVAPNSPTPSGPPRRFPLFQALLLAFLSLFLLLLSILLSVLLFRRIRPAHHAPAPSPSAASSSRRDNHGDDAEQGDDDDEGRSLKPPPMPTSSTNPSTEFLYLGTLASSATPPPPSTHLRPGSPELRPLPPLPRTGPPSGEFFAPRAAANPSSSSSSWLSPSSPSASSPTLGSSPSHIHATRPPSIPQPRGRAPNPSPPKRRPSPPPSPPHHSWNPFAPAPPPPRAAPSSSSDGAESYTTEMRKSRPLHSDKLRPGSLHMKDEMIQLYLNNSAAAVVAREVCLLGAPRCRGIGMVLAALGVSQEQVRDALLEGNAHGLGVEALRMLTQLVPTNEEELKLRYFKDDPPAKLCKVDAFLKIILDVPFVFKRVDAMLYVSNFYLEVNQLRMSYATLEAACQELRSSRLFHRVLGAVLNFGNLMSINTGSPNSHGLEPNTLLKIVDVKGADGKAALLHFIVQEIVKPEGHNSLNTMHSAGSAACKTNAGTLPYGVDCRKHGLQVVATLAAELTSTKKAASIDVPTLSRTVSELGAGLGKIHDVLRLNSMATSTESARRFHEVMGTFLRQAEEEILELQAQESVCLSSVKEMAEYFHGDGSASSDEARMFRVFAGIREFVAMLDRICREAGEINDGGRVGSTQTASWMAPMGMTMATP
ncbi:formin-like protein 14 [Lolium rigidum]|uniref:formin-like protein 14 n=1 Tax=Lolium rigidum TaxID=89674 RepID=UPI001F5C1494|nr:formin-like protein 14 [Lolium rigidum]